MKKKSESTTVGSIESPWKKILREFRMNYIQLEKNRFDADEELKEKFFREIYQQESNEKYGFSVTGYVCDIVLRLDEY